MDKDFAQVAFFIAVITVVILLLVLLVVNLLLTSRNRRLRHQAEMNKMESNYREAMAEVRMEVAIATLSDVARDLHDEVGQLLTFSILQLGNVKNMESTGRDQMLGEIESSVREALEAVRTISRGLSPDFVNEMGLKSALEMLMERAGKRTGLKYELRLAPDFKVKDKSNEVIVFHILRECLTNSLRHAKASKITLTLRDNNGHAEIHFIDDGNGFEEENGKKSSMGLRTMMERAALMNGTLSVNSEKGKGTVILLIFPNL